MDVEERIDGRLNPLLASLSRNISTAYIHGIYPRNISTEYIHGIYSPVAVARRPKLGVFPEAGVPAEEGSGLLAVLARLPMMLRGSLLPVARRAVASGIDVDGGGSRLASAARSSTTAATAATAPTPATTALVVGGGGCGWVLAAADVLTAGRLRGRQGGRAPGG
jgi:hypothetical protein